MDVVVVGQRFLNDEGDVGFNPVGQVVAVCVSFRGGKRVRLALCFSACGVTPAGKRAIYNPKLLVVWSCKMSGGSPVAGSGFMRKRHSQGCFEDLEDDASSRGSHLSVAVTYRAQTWTHVLENFLWITSAVFMIYLGDSHRNLFSVLCWDSRIRRWPLVLGLLSSLANLAMILYGAAFVRSPQKYPEKCALLPSYTPLVAVLGLLSFLLFSSALWPIWRFLTIPLVFTLFMAMMVISPYLPVGPLRPQAPILVTV